jgi:hypothetical protein
MGRRMLIYTSQKSHDLLTLIGIHDIVIEPPHQCTASTGAPTLFTIPYRWSSSGGGHPGGQLVLAPATKNTLV